MTVSEHDDPIMEKDLVAILKDKFQGDLALTFKWLVCNQFSPDSAKKIVNLVKKEFESE